MERPRPRVVHGWSKVNVRKTGVGQAPTRRGGYDRDHPQKAPFLSDHSMTVTVTTSATGLRDAAHLLLGAKLPPPLAPSWTGLDWTPEPRPR